MRAKGIISTIALRNDATIFGLPGFRAARL
jgi:hypothetical protein